MPGSVGGQQKTESVRNGAIVWLKPESPRAATAYGVPLKACDHPCVVVGGGDEQELLSICVITSLHTFPADKKRAEAERRGNLYPIMPNSLYTRAPLRVVELVSGTKLWRDSWVNVKTVYKVPSTFLHRWENKSSINGYMLARKSVGNLRVWCGLPRQQITRGVGANSSQFFEELIDQRSAHIAASTVHGLNNHSSSSTKATAQKWEPAMPAGEYNPSEYVDRELTNLPTATERMPLLANQNVRRKAGIQSPTRQWLEAARTQRDFYDEEVGQVPHSRQWSATAAIGRVLRAVWKRLPSSRTVFKTMLMVLVIVLCVAMIWVAGYGIYWIVHKVLSLISGWLHSIGQLISGAIHLAQKAASTVASWFVAGWHGVKYLGEWIRSACCGLLKMVGWSICCCS